MLSALYIDDYLTGDSCGGLDYCKAVEWWFDDEYIAILVCALTGFPPIRENFEDLFRSGKMGFSAKIGEKILKSGNFFFKTIFNLLNFLI